MLYSTDRSTVQTALQYRPLYSTDRSTVQTAPQYRPLYSTDRSTVQTALQYIPLYSTYHSTVHTALQYIPLYSTDHSLHLIYRETDKLLFGVFTQLSFRNTHLFLEQEVTKSKGIIEYPLKIVEVV